METYKTITGAISTIVEEWGEKGKEVIASAFEEHKKIEMKDFLNHCTACGGNWGGMFLTGIKELYPKTYKAIPEKMGAFAFSLIVYTLFLCGVNIEE